MNIHKASEVVGMELGYDFTLYFGHPADETISRLSKKALRFRNHPATIHRENDESENGDPGSC